MGAASHEPGTKFVEVARRYEVSRGLLWQWQDVRRRGTRVTREATFLAVRVLPELPMAASSAADAPVERDDRIEIVLPDGTAVRVPEMISTTALRRVLSVLRG